MPRLEPARGVALPMVLGIVLAMGVSLVSVWREVRLQTWTTRQDVTRQQTRQALQALARDAQRDLQSGSAWLRNTQGPGCQAGVCTNIDTSLWSATQWAARASEGARFGEASATQASPLALGELANARYWLESLPYDTTQRLRGGPEPLSPARLYRITVWLPATLSHAMQVEQVLWFQDDTDPRTGAAAGQQVGWRKLTE
jgi:Tfp pilus assembly protein PilX